MAATVTAEAFAANSTQESLTRDDMIQMYADRLPSYSAFSFFSIGFNLFSLIAILRIKSQTSIYYIFLANLALCDIFGALVLWFYHNYLIITPGLRISQECKGLLRNFESSNVTLEAFEKADGVMHDNSSFSLHEIQECLDSQKKDLIFTLCSMASIILALTNNVVSLFLLTLNQYLSIICPFFVRRKFEAKKGWLVVVGSWLIATVLSSLPSLGIFIVAVIREDYNVHSEVISSPFEIIACLQAVLVIIVIVFYIKIYRVVLECKRNTMNLTATITIKSTNETLDDTHNKAPKNVPVLYKLFKKKSVNRVKKSTEKSIDETQNVEIDGAWPMEMHSLNTTTRQRTTQKVPIQRFDHNYKAFLTTMVLTGALIFCWIPYFFLTFMLRHDFSDNVMWYLSIIKFYIIDFLPIVSYILDPIIFGLRINSVRASYKQLLCFFKKNNRR